MELRHRKANTVVDVDDHKAHRLVRSGNWGYVHPPAESPVETRPASEAANTQTFLDAPASPQPATKPAPTIDAMRQWARKEHPELGVRETGKLPRAAVKAYLAAHEE